MYDSGIRISRTAVAVGRCGRLDRAVLVPFGMVAGALPCPPPDPLAYPTHSSCKSALSPPFPPSIVGRLIVICFLHGREERARSPLPTPSDVRRARASWQVRGSRLLEFVRPNTVVCLHKTCIPGLTHSSSFVLLRKLAKTPPVAACVFMVYDKANLCAPLPVMFLVVI